MAKTTTERYEEEWHRMPMWKKTLAWIFFVSVPFIASIENISF